MVKVLTNGRQVICFLLGVAITTMLLLFFTTDTKPAFLDSRMMKEEMVKSTTNVTSPRDLSVRTANASTNHLNSLIQEMTKLLQEKLALPNDAQKIIFDKPCTDSQSVQGCVGPCDQPLSSDPAERLKNLLEDPALMLSDSQRESIMSMGRTVPENDYIIITACSSGHFNEMQAMFYNLHNQILPILHNVTVVLFDIGLTSRERLLAEKNCHCHVATFPKEKFPKHVRDNECFGWKPLMEMTFNYMRMKPCAFFPYPEVVAGAVIHRNDAFNRRVLMETKARCALEKNCICPVRPRSVLNCKPGKLIHRCHRFDQSVLTILLARIYGQDMYKILAPERSYSEPEYCHVKRGDNMPHYFQP